MTDGAYVEIIDTTTADDRQASVLVPTLFRINGVDIGYLAEDGLELRQGDVRIDKFEPGAFHDVTAITFTIFPRLVEIKREHPESGDSGGQTT